MGELEGLNNSVTTQAQIQGFVLVHLDIYPICTLLVYMKRLVLPIQSYRITMTQCNNRIPKKSLSEASVLMVYQKPRGLEPD